MSRTKYPHIFREGKIGNVTIPNRLCMSPMGVGNYSEFFEDRLIDFYGARARGGIGLVFFENNYVSSIAEDPYPRFMPVPRFDDRRKISSTYSIVKRVRNYGAVAGVQLGAGQGRFADVVDPDHPPMGPKRILRRRSRLSKELPQWRSSAASRCWSCMRTPATCLSSSCLRI